MCMTPTDSSLQCSNARPMVLDVRRSAGVRAFAVCMCVLAVPTGAWASQRLPAMGSVEVAFSPADDPQSLLVSVIGSARQTIRVQAYVFTSRTIAKALVDAHARGVEVEVLADAKMNRREKGNAIPTLLAAGIPVAFETDFAAAHNKVLIVDAELPGCTVVTGSYNFTWSAQHRNAENVVVLRENCPLAALYLENWQRHRAVATPVTRLP